MGQGMVGVGRKRRRREKEKSDSTQRDFVILSKEFTL
jgi:hypothetical protein